MPYYGCKWQQALGNYQLEDFLVEIGVISVYFLKGGGYEVMCKFIAYSTYVMNVLSVNFLFYCRKIYMVCLIFILGSKIYLDVILPYMFLHVILNILKRVTSRVVGFSKSLNNGFSWIPQFQGSQNSTNIYVVMKFMIK